MLQTNNKDLTTKCSLSWHCHPGKGAGGVPKATRGMGEHYTLSIGDLGRALEADAACIEKKLR